MDVGSYETVLLLNLSETTDVHVLADNSDLGSKCLLYSQSRVFLPLLCQELINIFCSSLNSLSCYVCYVGLEFLVLCNEVSLSIYLYNNSLVVVIDQAGIYNTLCCDTASLLLCACKAFLSQPVNSCVHISLGSCQGLLAVHHASAGHFS